MAGLAGPYWKRLSLWNTAFRGEDPSGRGSVLGLCVEEDWFFLRNGFDWDLRTYERLPTF